MKIVDAKVIITCPGRNFVTLKITTEDGVYGLGDATLNGRELAVASYLTDHVIPCLIGRDARRIEDTWQYLYKGAYWRRGPVTMSAICAVDTALWDIKGKALNMPVYELLGGRVARQRAGLRPCQRPRLEDTVAAVARSTRRWATTPSARRAAFRALPAPTASARAACTTSRPKRGCPARACGAPRST